MRSFKNKIKEILTEKAISILVAMGTFLVYSYISTFATNARVDLLESKVDRVLSGLCIIDARTCSLKDNK